MTHTPWPDRVTAQPRASSVHWLLSQEYGVKAGLDHLGDTSTLLVTDRTGRCPHAFAVPLTLLITHQGRVPEQEARRFFAAARAWFDAMGEAVQP